MFRTIFNENERLWRGMDMPKSGHEVTSIGAGLLKAMQRYPKKIAQISANNNVQYTYEEIYIKSVRAAQNIQRLEFKEGDVFSIMSKNNHDLAPVVIALLFLGYPFQTLDPSFTETETTHLLARTKPTVVFSDLESYDVVERSLRSLENEAEVYTFGAQIGRSRLVEDLFAETGREAEFVVVEVADKQKTALILCSSGTTDLSKPICITHEVALSQLPHSLIEKPHEVTFCFSSLYWLSGVQALLLGILESSTRLITTDSFSPESMLHLIQKHKVTSLFSGSFQMVLTLKCAEKQITDLTSVERWFCGGSKISNEITIAVQNYIPNGLVLVVYGTSELFGSITVKLCDGKNESVGQLVGGTTVKIVDENGNRLGVGQDGEVCVKNVYKFAGYYGDRVSTDALYDTEGFLQTGDIGHFDGDGSLYLVDRKKDILRYREHTISPSEIENFLSNRPEIESASVVGITDSSSNDLPAAVVVRQRGSTITEAEINNMIAKAFDDSRKLRGGIYFVDALPVTPSGKILRRKLKIHATKLYEASVQHEFNGLVL